MTRARVVGAGLSGLTAAWWLAERGFDVEVIEQAQEPGGLIHTRHMPFGLVETAANAFVWTDTTARWFARLGIEPRFPRPGARKRYIYRAGCPRRWPLGTTETAAALGRLASAAASRRLRARPDESVAGWSDRVLGHAATRWLVGPALQGIYAVPPDHLSARAVAGSRSRGRVRLAAPPGGMGEFIERLHEVLGRRGVRFQFGRPAQALVPDVPTIIATGAPAAAKLLVPHVPELASAAAAVRVVHVTTVTAFFERTGSDLPGFGVLFPAESGIAARGVLFNDEIFDERSTLRSETWIYGSGEDQEPVSEADAHARLVRDRTTLTGKTAEPRAVQVTVWPQALPVYDAAILGVRDALPRRPAWLALAGNYLGRIGVAGLLDAAERAAQSVDPH